MRPAADGQRSAQRRRPSHNVLLGTWPSSIWFCAAFLACRHSFVCSSLLCLNEKQRTPWGLPSDAAEVGSGGGGRDVDLASGQNGCGTRLAASDQVWPAFHHISCDFDRAASPRRFQSKSAGNMPKCLGSDLFTVLSTQVWPELGHGGIYHIRGGGPMLPHNLFPAASNWLKGRMPPTVPTRRILKQCLTSTAKRHARGKYKKRCCFSSE